MIKVSKMEDVRAKCSECSECCSDEKREEIMKIAEMIVDSGLLEDPEWKYQFENEEFLGELGDLVAESIEYESAFKRVERGRLS